MLSTVKLKIGRALKHAFELYFDWQLGIRTEARSLPVQRIEYDDANKLQPLSYYCLWKLRRYLRREAAAGRVQLDGELVDFGCGNGRSMAFLKRTPFRRVAGIEIDAGYCEIARENLAKAADWTVIHGDATAYEPTGEESVLFFFNPFGVRTLRAVLGQAGYPSKVTVIYVKPGEEQLALFRELFPNARIKIEHWYPDTAIVSA